MIWAGKYEGDMLIIGITYIAQSSLKLREKRSVIPESIKTIDLLQNK